MEDLIASVKDEEEVDEEWLRSVAKERYEQYLKNPGEGMSWEEFRNRIYNKYNF